MRTSYLKLLAALSIDGLLAVLFQQPVAFCGAMLFVHELFKEQRDWLMMGALVLLQLVESFIVVQQVGLPLLYMVPLSYGARQVRRHMHPTRLVYPVFLGLLLIADKVLAGYLIHGSLALDTSTLAIFCGNLIVIMIISLK